MGGSYYSADTYSRRVSSHKAAGTSMFTHHTSIASGATAAKVHEKLDPSKLNAAGKNVRESFDSPAHPASRPVAVLFDVTGSMSTVPNIFVEKLDKLMAGLVKKGYIQDPHVLFGAIGDATCDKVPLQIGQFEAGNEMDEALSLVYKESGGGGQNTESYELAMYYMARHTDLDSIKKRNEKGYLFLMGDELPYSHVKSAEVTSVIGGGLQDDLPTSEILKELRAKFEVFWIMPAGTSNYNNRHINEELNKMFGQNFLKLESPSDVCELIISTIGVCEGYDINTVVKDLAAIGADKDSIARSAKALDKYNPTAVTKSAKVTGTLAKSKKEDLVERL